MNEFSSRVRAETINEELSYSKLLILGLAWSSSLAWVSIAYLADQQLPFDKYIRAALACTAIGWAGIALYAHILIRKKETAQLHLERAFLFAAVLFLLPMIFFTANVFYGTRENIILMGKVPVISLGIQISVLVTFCLLELQRAVWVSIIYTATMAFLALSHLWLRYDHYESFYGFTITALSICLINPICIALLMIFFRLQARVIKTADREVQSSQDVMKKTSLIASKDQLTGAMNRFGMWSSLEKTYAQHPTMTIIVIKAKDEQKVANQFGAHSTDKLYCQMHHVITACIDKKWQISRRDASEFVLWCDANLSIEAMESVGGRIIDSLSKMSELQWDGHAEFQGAGRNCSQEKPPAIAMEEATFLIQYAHVGGKKFCANLK